MYVYYTQSITSVGPLQKDALKTKQNKTNLQKRSKNLELESGFELHPENSVLSTIRDPGINQTILIDLYMLSLMWNIRKLKRSVKICL